MMKVAIPVEDQGGAAPLQKWPHLRSDLSKEIPEKDDGGAADQSHKWGDLSVEISG